MSICLFVSVKIVICFEVIRVITHCWQLYLIFFFTFLQLCRFVFALLSIMDCRTGKRFSFLYDILYNCCMYLSWGFCILKKEFPFTIVRWIVFFYLNFYSRLEDKDIPMNTFQSEQGHHEPEFAYPQFKNIQQRISSYADWPEFAKQAPTNLAKSGLFYTGLFNWKF